MNKKIWLSVLGLVIAGGAIWYFVAANHGNQQANILPAVATSTTPQTEPTSTATTTPNIAIPGGHCGGNILNAPTCPAGYTCQPTSGGICVAVSLGGKG